MLTIVKGKAFDEIDEKHLCMADPDDVRTVLQNCAIKRLYTAGTRGYRSQGRKANRKQMAATGDIPSSIYWNPKFNFIFHNPDAREGDRLRRKFLEKFPKFKVSERRLI